MAEHDADSPALPNRPTVASQGDMCVMLITIRPSYADKATCTPHARHGNRALLAVEAYHAYVSICESLCVCVCICVCVCVCVCV